MKLFIIVLLALIPLAGIAQKYKYNKVALLVTGCDNFSMDYSRMKEKNGIIDLNKTILSIDGKKFNLKQLKKDNTYKSKGYVFKLVYDKDGALSYIEQLQYDNVLNYYIQSGSAIVSN